MTLVFDWLATLSNTNLFLTGIFCLSVVVALLALLCRINRPGAGINFRFMNKKTRRLEIIETMCLTRTHHLVLVKRDNVEHLFMIGGANDILVETNLQKSKAGDYTNTLEQP